MVSTISTTKNDHCARIEAFCSLFFFKPNELIESITMHWNCSCVYLAGAIYASKEICMYATSERYCDYKSQSFFIVFYSKAFSRVAFCFSSDFISRDNSCPIFIVCNASVWRIYAQNQKEKLVLHMDAIHAVKTKRHFERKSSNQYNLWPSSTTRWTK